jgi:glutaredoxin 3
MPQIKVYSTQSCPWCHRAKDYFKNKGVVFEDIDVSCDQARAEEMCKISGQYGVTVITIDGLPVPL